MIKKILTVVLIFVMLPFGISSAKAEDKAMEHIVWSAPSTVKYMLDEKPASYNLDLSLEMCKNETEGIQLMVTAGASIFFDVSASDLVCGDNKISSNNITFYREHYVYVSQTTDFSAIKGYYPDALVPMSLSKEYGENKIRKGQNQGIWIDIKTDNTTVAGDYTSNVKLTLGTLEYNIPLKVKVYNVELPTTTTARRAFAIWSEEYLAAHFTNVNTQEYMEAYYEFMLDYKIAPTDLPNILTISDVNKQIEMIKTYGARDNVPCFSLPYMRQQVSVDGKGYYVTFDKTHMHTLLSGVIKNSTNESNLLKKAYLYFTFIDEQEPENYWKVIDTNARLKTLKQELASDVTLFPLDGSKDEVKESLLALEHVVTLTQKKPLYADEGADLQSDCGLYSACPLFSLVGDIDYLEEMNKKMSQGNKYWWYGCIGCREPYPTYNVNDNLLISRELSWMQKYFGIAGELNWCVNVSGTYIQPIGKYLSRDPYKDATGGFLGVSGDGYYVYPGSRYNQIEPLASIRLVGMRDGSEDYDLLGILDSELAKANKKYNTNITLQSYLKKQFINLFENVSYDRDITKFAAAKREVIQLIELLQSDANALVDYDINEQTSVANVSVYASHDSAIKIDGKAVSSSSSLENGLMFQMPIIMNSINNYAKIEATKNSVTATANRYLGQKVVNMLDFNNASLAGITATIPRGESSSNVALSINDNPIYTVTGKSLKADFTPVPFTTTYEPAVILSTSSGIIPDMSNYDTLLFRVYNASDKRLKIIIKLSDNDTISQEINSVYINANAWTNVEIKLKKDSWIDSSKITEIRIATPNATETQTLYFDNIALARKWRA